jgi:Flp pilus assembly protein TadB
MKAIIHVAAALALVAGLAMPSYGQEGQAENQQQAREQEQVYGWQLMTEQERNENRQRMRAAKTDQEREQIRAEHHAAMQVRAKEQGVTLPDEPLARVQGRQQSNRSGYGPRGYGGEGGQRGAGRMMYGMRGMGWGMGLIGLLVLIFLVLGIAALIKYLMSGKN